MGGAIIVCACAVVLGVVLGLALCRASVKRLWKRNRALRAIIKGEAEPEKRETMKRVVWACVLNGFAWVWCSYILAALDKPQIAEELSKVALAEIIVPVAVYALKSGVENLSKNNHWPDKTLTANEDSEGQEPPDAG